MQREMVRLTKHQAARLGALALDAVDEIKLSTANHTLDAAHVEFEDRDGIIAEYWIFTDGRAEWTND